MKKTFILGLLFTLTLLTGCSQAIPSQNIIPNEISPATESTDQTEQQAGDTDKSLPTEQFSGELILIQKHIIPDCRGLDGVPFYIFGADELTNMPANEIADLARNGYWMVYCDRQAGVDESEIAQHLMTYGITEKEAKEVMDKAFTKKQVEEMGVKEIK